MQRDMELIIDILRTTESKTHPFIMELKDKDPAFVQKIEIYDKNSLTFEEVRINETP